MVLNRKTFFILLLVGIAFRAVLLLNVELVNGGDVDVYLADEGIVGLMAMHIREGRALPIFFYGQHYLGALEAYLAALSFSLFGASLLALRATTFAVSLGLLWAVYAFARRAYSTAAARWATTLVALSPMYFLQWNLKARGGFVEHILLLFVLMILLWRFLYEKYRRTWPTFLLGLTAGIAFWVNQLALSYLLVIAAALVAEGIERRAWRSLAAGFLVGASLLIAYNTVHPLATFRTLARKSITMNRVPAAERDDNWVVRGLGKRLQALSNGADKIGMVFGVPPRAGVARLGLSAEARSGDRLTRVR